MYVRDEFVRAGMPEISVTQNWIPYGICTLLSVVDFFYKRVAMIYNISWTERDQH